MTNRTAPVTPVADSGVLRINQAMRPEARYKALVENLPDVLIVLFDAQLRMIAFEGGLQQRIPGRHSDMIGKTMTEIFGAEMADPIEQHYRTAMTDGQVSFDFDHPDGSVWWTTVIPMVDDQGQVVGGMAKWRDVTGRVMAEREMERYAIELERSNHELEQFAYIASHDLSEPLRMVTGYLSLLERRYGAQLDDDAKQFIGFAVDGAARMRGLIDDLLAFSRVGRAEITPDEVDTQTLVEDVFHLLTAEREGPEATLLATGLPVVRGDTVLLRQLFQNLLSNAIKFVEPGQGAVAEVTAELLADASGFRFTVADDGIGIDPNQTERIFGVFQRLHTRDEFPGTGVGLAVARKVVEHHGGTIWVQPRDGGGTRIVFELKGTV